jgi:C1A family cysteine protease
MWSFLFGNPTVPVLVTATMPVCERKLGWNYNEIDMPISEELFPFKQLSYHLNLDSIAEVDFRTLKYYYPCYDQGSLGSCTANGWIFEYVFEMVKEGKPFVDMSREAFYYCERDAMGTVDQDSGASISAGADVMLKTGVCLESLCPYDVTTYTVRPSDACYEDMKLHMGEKVERVKKTVNDLKQCLLNGNPFVFGFKVYESFMKVGHDGIVPMPDTKKEKLMGGHCVTCVGFKKINDKDYFIIRNSWGTDTTNPNGTNPDETVVKAWGDNGHCFMSFEFMIQSSGIFGTNQMCSDFWTIKLVKDAPDPNIPETDEQKLEHIKKIVGSDTNNLDELCEQIKKLQVAN